MPHTPQKFEDKEEAEMMAYALEEHFLRITTLLDAAEVPTYGWVGGKSISQKLTVEQRVWLLIHSGEKRNDADFKEYIERIPPDTYGEDPEELAEKIAALYERNKV